MKKLILIPALLFASLVCIAALPQYNVTNNALSIPVTEVSTPTTTHYFSAELQCDLESKACSILTIKDLSKECSGFSPAPEVCADLNSLLQGR